MKVKFNEKKLTKLGYTWNVNKTYMFKTMNIKHEYKPNNKIESATLFVSCNGTLDMWGDSDKAMEILFSEIKGMILK